MFSRRNLGLAAGMTAAVALTAGAIIASTGSAIAEAPIEISAAAPAFTGTNSNGETVNLADFEGKTVVLEWTNDGCPFVQKHYAEPRKNMQATQLGATEDDVVWLSVISSAPGEQGHADGGRANELTTSRGASPTHVLIDESGDIGRLYGAKTTPHMFVVNAEGNVVYKGAIDNVRSADPADIDGATNYVNAALASVAAGEAVQEASTKEYGCSVKYAK